MDSQHGYSIYLAIITELPWTAFGALSTTEEATFSSVIFKRRQTVLQLLLLKLCNMYQNNLEGKNNAAAQRKEYLYLSFG